MTLHEFINANRPEVKGNIRYWAEWVFPDRVSYTAFVRDDSPAGGHYDEEGKVIVPFPPGEKAVTLSIPPWVTTTDPGADTCLRNVFLSEAREAVELLQQQLQKLSAQS